MSVIRISPDRLRDASQHLAQVNAQLEDQLRRLAGVAGILQSDWQGMGAMEFQQEFYQVHALGARSSEAAARLVALLGQHAQKLASMQGGGASPMAASGGGGVLMAGGAEAVSIPSDAVAVAPAAPAAPAMASTPVIVGGGQEVAMGGAGDPLAAYGPAGAAAPAAGAGMAMASSDVNLGGAGPALAWGGDSSPYVPVDPKLQHDGDNCGKTAVAMAVNAVTGKNLEDWDLPAEGCSLLGELNARSEGSGVTWTDKNLDATNWHYVEQSLAQGCPVVVGLNGEFSASGYGHIVTIVGVNGDTVAYADPATGTIRETTRQAILECPPHTDGKFMMFGQRTAG